MSDHNGASEPSSGPHESVPPGARFDRYEVLRLLGHGGMGNVYEARHVDLDKRVALKVLGKRVSGNKVYLERFLREGRLAAKLDHPHVVTVFDVGTFEGKPYLVMEYLSGRDLAGLLDERGRLSVEETIDVVLPILAALDVAHRAGLVHRDLKPANIFLVRAGHGGFHPKLLDFGIAKPNQEDGAALTATSEVFGTPQYMAPEQVRKSRDATSRADQYSMGVVLYRCLSGEDAFEIGDSSIYELLERVVSGSFPRLRDKSPELPEQLERVVARAMSHKPAERYRSVRELGAALLPFASMTTKHLWTAAFAEAEAVAETLAPQAGKGPDQTPTRVIPGSAPDLVVAESAPSRASAPGTLTTSTRDTALATASPRPSAPKSVWLGAVGVLIGAAASVALASALIGGAKPTGPAVASGDDLASDRAAATPAAPTTASAAAQPPRVSIQPSAQAVTSNAPPAEVAPTMTAPPKSQGAARPPAGRPSAQATSQPSAAPTPPATLATSAAPAPTPYSID